MESNNGGNALVLAEVFLKTIAMVCLTVLGVTLIMGWFGGLG